MRLQASDWRSYQDKVAGAAPPSEGAGARVAGGKIGTTVEEKVPAAAPGRDQLKVSPQAGKGAPGSAAEEVVSRDKALKEAQARINDLEKTLKDLQKALELKGQPGGAQVAQAGKAPEPAKAEPPKAGVPAPEMKAPEPPKVEPPKVEPPKVEPPKAEPPKVRAAQGGRPCGASSRRRRHPRQGARAQGRRRARRRPRNRPGSTMSSAARQDGSSAVARSPRWRASRR